MDFIHILAGSLALITGAVAFTVKKGGYYHKKAGLLFVVSMLIMALTGALLALLKTEILNAVAGALTSYLVSTAYLAIHRTRKNLNYVNIGLMLFAFLLGCFGIYYGLHIVDSDQNRIDGQPIQVLFVFSGVALMAAALDLKSMLKSLNAKQRLQRHIWRIGLSMFLATASFFLGQSQVIPDALRTIFVLVTPVLLTLLLTIFWLIRVQFWGLGKR